MPRSSSLALAGAVSVIDPTPAAPGPVLKGFGTARVVIPLTRLLRVGAVVALAIVVLLPAAPVSRAADGLEIDAHALLQGHARAGSWFAIAVDMANAGPTITGELRISGGLDSATRFGTPVELATGSRKRFILYAQPPSFGGTMTVSLVSGDQTIVKAQVAVALHDQSQLVVGVLSDNPGKVIGELGLLPSQSGTLPTIVTLTPDDLPERLQAWSVLDRLIWQDTDSANLTPGQLAALEGWVAGGGRLVIAGGTSGADALAAFPDSLLPYRPTGLLDIDPAVLRPLLGGLPKEATTLPALAGDLVAGRALATSGDRVIAADRAVGAGSVTILGFDPTTSWLAEGDAYDAPLWRRLLPPRAGGTAAMVDDSTILGAVANLPSLALPPIGGLIVLLIGYIVLVGPVNYIVLRLLDRREWAWATVPALIGVFAVGSFGFGATIRGSEVIIHEVAIVRGAPGSASAIAQSYLGIFSPSRSTFQVQVPGDALLAAPMNGDAFGNNGSAALDILQGDPSSVRNLAVGFGSLRTIRAEASTTGPIVTADLRLEDDQVLGTIHNGSDRALVSPALVLGGSVQVLSDIPAGGTAQVKLRVVSGSAQQFSLSDRVVGQVSFDTTTMTDSEQRKLVRRSIVDQLTFDPITGVQGSLGADTPVLLAWGTDPVVPIAIEGQRLRRVSNILYDIPLPFTVHGKVTFGSDLLRTSILDQSANFFSKDPWQINFGTGSIRMAFRPIPFDGTFSPDEVLVSLTFGGDNALPGGISTPLEETVRCSPDTAGCVPPQDGLPELEVLDRTTGTWVQFKHLVGGRLYSLKNPSRWIDPGSGELQVRFVNERQDAISFQFPVQIKGVVR